MSTQEKFEAQEPTYYVAALHMAIVKFKEEQDIISFSMLLSKFFEGIEENYSVPIPGELDYDTMSIKPTFLRGQDGTEHLVFLTDPDGEKYPYIASVKMRALMGVMFGNDNCGGILINPDDDNKVLILRDLIASAINAGISLTQDQVDDEEEQIRIRRPIDEQEFDRIADRILAFDEDEDDFLILDLADDPDMLFIQVIRNEKLLHVELAFDMSDFKWLQPLILANDMPVNEALTLLHRLCVDGESPDNIDVIQTEFHQVSLSKSDEDESE